LHEVHEKKNGAYSQKHSLVFVPLGLMVWLNS